MTNDEGSPNDEFRIETLRRFCHSDFVILLSLSHSSVVISFACLHRHCVRAQQSGSEMVPREIFHYPMSCRAAHSLNDFRMPVQMLQGGCDSTDIPWFHDDSFDAIAHYVACLTRGYLRQRARRCLVRHFGAALPLRRENVYHALVEVILRIAHKSDNANVIAPKLP